jgi:hypothetical protein
MMGPGTRSRRAAAPTKKRSGACHECSAIPRLARPAQTARRREKKRPSGVALRLFFAGRFSNYARLPECSPEKRADRCFAGRETWVFGSLVRMSGNCPASAEIGATGRGG